MIGQPVRRVVLLVLAGSLLANGVAFAQKADTFKEAREKMVSEYWADGPATETPPDSRAETRRHWPWRGAKKCLDPRE